MGPASGGEGIFISAQRDLCCFLSSLDVTGAKKRPFPQPSYTMLQK